MEIETFHGGRAVVVLGRAEEQLPLFGPYDSIITDPPYSSGGMVRGDRTQSTRVKYQSSGELEKEHPEFTGDNRDQRGYLVWSTQWLAQALDATKPGGGVAVFTDWRQLPTTTDALQCAGWVWRGIAPWDKKNARPAPNRFRAQCEYLVWGSHGGMDNSKEEARYLPGFFQGLPPTRERVHATQKSLAVMRQIVQYCPPGGVICDPFLGSGTTGEAALLEGRYFVGFEQSRPNFDNACKRLEAVEL